MKVTSKSLCVLSLLSSITVVVAIPSNGPASSAIVSQTTCAGKKYTYESLAGYGFIPSDARDKFGDTLGGIGSSIAIKKAS